jgi:hypothetical protein
MELLVPFGTCQLCGEQKELRHSHVVPAFVARWHKDHSVNKRFRFNIALDKTEQDFPTWEMLCDDCEQLIGTSENLVRQEIFVPLHDSGVERFRYGPWFPQFAASMSFRALTVLRENDKVKQSPPLISQIDGALKTWRLFLLGRVSTVAPYDQHVLPLGLACMHVSEQARTMLNVALFTNSGIALCPSTDGSMYVISKLARLLVVGVVIDNQKRKWRGTKLHVKGGAWGDDHYDTPDCIRAWLLSLGKDLDEAIDSISPRQQQRTEERFWRTVIREPDTLEKSETVRVLLREDDDRDVETETK